MQNQVVKGNVKRYIKVGIKKLIIIQIFSNILGIFFSDSKYIVFVSVFPKVLLKQIKLHKYIIITLYVNSIWIVKIFYSLDNLYFRKLL